MNLCLAYMDLPGDLFRCLCHDLHIPFTPAPKPGKYTRKIGEVYARGTLCEGLCDVLGSLCECCYLGADTALVFVPCGSCSTQRILLKLQNCFKQNGLQLRLIAVEPLWAGRRELFRFLKENSNCSLYEFWEAKRRFCECALLLERFWRLKTRLEGSANVHSCLQTYEKELLQANSLLEFKIYLNFILKKLAAFEDSRAPEIHEESLLYEADIYGGESGGFYRFLQAHLPCENTCTAHKTARRSGEKTLYLSDLEPN